MVYNKKKSRERGLRKMKYRLKLAKDNNDANEILKYKHIIEKRVQEFGDSH